MLVLKVCLVAVSLSGTSFAVGVREETILHWLQRAAEQSERVNARLVQEVPMSQVLMSNAKSSISK